MEFGPQTCVDVLALLLATAKATELAGGRRAPDVETFLADVTQRAAAEGVDADMMDEVSARFRKVVGRVMADPAKYLKPIGLTARGKDALVGSRTEITKKSYGWGMMTLAVGGLAAMALAAWFNVPEVGQTAAVLALASRIPGGAYLGQPVTLERLGRLPTNWSAVEDGTSEEALAIGISQVKEPQEIVGRLQKLTNEFEFEISTPSRLTFEPLLVRNIGNYDYNENALYRRIALDQLADERKQAKQQDPREAPTPRALTPVQTVEEDVVKLYNISEDDITTRARGVALERTSVFRDVADFYELEDHLSPHVASLTLSEDGGIQLAVGKEFAQTRAGRFIRAVNKKDPLVVLVTKVIDSDERRLVLAKLPTEYNLAMDNLWAFEVQALAAALGLGLLNVVAAGCYGSRHFEVDEAESIKETVRKLTVPGISALLAVVTTTGVSLGATELLLVLVNTLTKRTEEAWDSMPSKLEAKGMAFDNMFYIIALNNFVQITPIVVALIKQIGGGKQKQVAGDGISKIDILSWVPRKTVGAYHSAIYFVYHLTGEFVSEGQAQQVARRRAALVNSIAAAPPVYGPAPETIEQRMRRLTREAYARDDVYGNAKMPTFSSATIGLMHQAALRKTVGTLAL